MERWNRWGINSKPGSEGFRGGRTRTAIQLVPVSRAERAWRGTEKQTNFDGGFGIFIGSATPSTVFTAHTEPAITARSARDGTESGRCARRRARGGDRHDPGFLNQRSRVKRSQENRSGVLKRDNRHRVSILVVCVVVAVGVVVTRGVRLE